MNKLFDCPLIVVFLICIGLYSCDNTSSPNDIFREVPVVTLFTVSPDEVIFTLEDGFGDTTVTVNVEAQFDHANALSEPMVLITDKESGEIIAEQPLEHSDLHSQTYTAEFQITTSTTAIEDYIITLIYDDKLGNYAQTYMHIRGFSNAPPLILETVSPDTIYRPSSGEIPAMFTAKVTDEDGQETINNVYLRVINQESGEVEGSPFIMFDDGSTYDDEVANDSVYTWSLPVTPTDNNPNRNFDIEFFAIDNGGMVSDTIKTTFSIVE